MSLKLIWKLLSNGSLNWKKKRNECKLTKYGTSTVLKLERKKKNWQFAKIFVLRWYELVPKILEYRPSVTQQQTEDRQIQWNSIWLENFNRHSVNSNRSNVNSCFTISTDNKETWRTIFHQLDTIFYYVHRKYEFIVHPLPLLTNGVSIFIFLSSRE